MWLHSVRHVNFLEFLFPVWFSSFWLAKTNQRLEHVILFFVLSFLFYFENFDDNFFIISYIDAFENFTVFASTKFSYDLIIILISTQQTNNYKSAIFIERFTPIRQHAARSRNIR